MENKTLRLLVKENLINSSIDNEITIHDDDYEVDFECNDYCNGEDGPDLQDGIIEKNQDFEIFYNYRYDYNVYDFYENQERDYEKEFSKWVNEKLGN